MTNEQTDWRALCAELIQLDKEQPTEYSDWKKRWNAAVSRTRAALAQPEPQGPTDKELHQLWQELYSFHDGPTSGEVAEIARAALARWGRAAIEPVPVAEPLPGPGPEDYHPDNDWCWGWYGWRWRMMDSTCFYPGCEATHWLPHHALPVPGAEVG